MANFHCGVHATQHKGNNSLIYSNYSFVNARLEYYSKLQIFPKQHKNQSMFLQQTEQKEQR